MAATLAVPARPAAACSCATFDTRRALADHPAAFVGTVISRDPPPAPAGEQPSADEVTFRFRVENAVKGDLGGEVDVRSPGDQAACGIAAPAETPVGLILSERDGQWVGSLCLQPSPERLLRAAQPLPPPDGRLPPDLLIGSTYGNGRSVGLDRDGRVAALGGGPGTTLALAVCPDRERAVELFNVAVPGGGTAPAVAVRHVETMAVEAEHVLVDLRADGTSSRSVGAVACRDREGRDLLLFARDGLEASGLASIIRLQDGQATTIWDGPAPRAVSFAPAGRTAYLNLYPSGEDVVAVDLEDPEQARARTRVVARVPPESGPMVVSPGGRYLATVAATSSRPTRSVLVDLSTASGTVLEADVAGAGITGEMVWADEDRVVFTPRLRPAEWVRVFDTALREVASWAGWTAERSVVSGGRLYGASQGAVRVAPVETGPASLLRDLEDALMVAIVDVSVPSRAPDAPAPAPAPATTTTTTTSPAPTPRPSSTTTTTAEATPSTPTTTPPATAPAPDRPPANQDEEAARPARPAGNGRPDEGASSATLPLLLLALGVAGAGGGAAVVRRRRRSD